MSGRLDLSKDIEFPRYGASEMVDQMFFNFESQLVVFHTLGTKPTEV